jgi:hypothetical protein
MDVCTLSLGVSLSRIQTGANRIDIPMHAVPVDTRHKSEGATAVQTNTTLATNAMSLYRVYTVHVVRAMHAQAN